MAWWKKARERQRLRLKMCQTIILLKKKKKTPLRVHKILAAVRCVTTICKS